VYVWSRSPLVHTRRPCRMLLADSVSTAGANAVIRRQIEDVRLDPAATDERSVVCQSLRHTAP
jgi:hypothetical protein